jgi:hypothetical protein
MYAFPALFAIACSKDAWVEENMAIVNGATQWNVLFIRPVHDWELEEVSSFFELLYSQQIRHGGEDKICWNPLKRKNFEVKSYYKMRINVEPVEGPWKSIWKSKAPPRVAGIFRVDSDIGENTNNGQFTQDEYHSNGVVLYVQEEWRIYCSFVIAL